MTRREPGLASGLLLGSALDALLADPRRAHPVAAFGTAASRAEARLWAASRTRGALFAVACAGPVAAAGWGLQRLAGRGSLTALTAAATWTVLGGASLAAEASAVARALAAGDLAAARARLPALCGRDPAGLSAAELARATVESVAENTSDAAVAPLLWGAVFGLPGLLGYRAVNTLDAMVGHKTARYARFGWAAARLDDVANLVPARATALLTAALAATVGGSGRDALRTLRRDGGAHPSPNAGRCEAAFAGALGVRLGGTNVYQGEPERRGTLGDGRPPAPADIDRAVRLSRLVIVAATVLSAALAYFLDVAGTARGRPAHPAPRRPFADGCDNHQQRKWWLSHPQLSTGRATRPGARGTRLGARGMRPGARGTRLGARGTRPGARGTRPGARGTRPGARGTRPGARGTGSVAR